jgi:hypothetical protein
MTMTRFYAAPDVDLEKFVSLLRQLADDVESHDAPIQQLQLGREIPVEDHSSLKMELLVAEQMDSELTDDWFDVYEDDIQ